MSGESQTEGRTLPALFGIEDEGLLQSITERASTVVVERGEFLFRAGDPGGELFIVVRGKLVAVGTDGAGRQWTSAMNAGATVGDIAVLTGAPRTADVVAARRSELLRVSRADFDSICELHPVFLRHLCGVLAGRLAQHASLEPRRPGSSERVIAVVGLDPDDTSREFTLQLAEELARLGSCRRLDQALARGELGASGASEGALEDHRFSDWLDAQEERHRFLLLDAGAEPGPWCSLCCAYADHVLLVARGSASPALREVEAGLYEGGGTSKMRVVSLVLLHTEETRLPRGTARWLEQRKLLEHHHVRPRRRADLQRLARALAQKSVGLVLSGGGALGAAHLGAIEALVERGVPIDRIGGTSAGGGVGALLAMGFSIEEVQRKIHQTFVKGRPFRRLTLPVLSVCDREVIDALAHEMFGDAQVEDLWLPYFCVSTDLTHAKVRVHRRGPLWFAVRATTSMAAIMPPVIHEGSVLVDGGALENLPVGPMREVSGGPIIAIDLEPETDLAVDYTYEQMPRSLRALARLLNPFGAAQTLPTIGRVLLRTLTIASTRERNQRQTDADLVLRPPLEAFTPFDIDAFETMREIGRQHARERFADVDVGALELGAWTG